MTGTATATPAGGAPPVVALDVGTSAVKAALVAGDGSVAQVAEVPLATSHPRPGWVEQDPSAWWEAAVASVRALGAEATTAAALAVTGQMQDLVPVHADGTAVRPAVLYADQRAADEHRALLDELGAAWGEAVGAPPDTTTVPAKWRWLQAHEPAAAAATAVLLLGAASSVVQRATGRAACDPTTAATTGFADVHGGRWWPPVVQATGAPLPPLHPATHVVGPLRTDAAAAFGLPAHLPVVLASGDAVATTVGVVGDEVGVPYAYLGTSGWVGVLTEEATPRAGVIVLPGARPGRWLAVAPVLTAGSAVDWAREELLGGLGTDDFERLAGHTCAAAEGVVFVPHLDGARVPVASVHGTGVLLGVRRGTARSVLAAAVVEGVAHAIRGVAAAVAPHAERLLLCGGLARSPLVAQVLADVLGVPVVTVVDDHAAVLGAASCARVALGGPPLPAASPRRTFTPRPDRQQAHARTAPVHDGMLTLLDPAFTALAAARGSGGGPPPEV